MCACCVCEVKSKMDCVAVCHAKTLIHSSIQMLQNMTSNFCRRAWCRTFSSVSVKNVERAPQIISDPSHGTGTWNCSVAANGVETIADRLGAVLPSSHALHVMPKCSAPNLLLELDRGALTGPRGNSYVGLVVKTVTGAAGARYPNNYNFTKLPLGLAHPSLLVCVCPAAEHIWVSKTGDLRLRNVTRYSNDALDYETAAQRLCEMGEDDGDIVRLSRAEWVRQSYVTAQHKRLRGLLAQLLEFPVFCDLEFCTGFAENSYNAVLRGKRILYRARADSRGTFVFRERFWIDGGVDAVVIMVGDKASNDSLRYVGILPKSLLDERSMMGADGVRGKNTLYVRHDLKFAGTMLEGLGSYFLDIVDASPDEIANFVSEKLG